MKKIWIVILSVYVTLVTAGCVLFGVLYFDLKLGLGSNTFARTRAEYIEAMDATYKVMNFDDSNGASAAAITDEDYEKVEDDADAKDKLERISNFILLTKLILQNDTYQLTNKIITFHVDDFLGAEKVNMKMQFDISGDEIYLKFYMTHEPVTQENDWQYVAVDIDYDYDNHEVRKYEVKARYGLFDLVENVKYNESDGTIALKETATGFKEFKQELTYQAAGFNGSNFENTDYDFTKEFKEANGM